MSEVLATMVPALAGALLHFLWQGLLVGLLAWFALALLRDARPQARYAVACLALLACVAMPAWSVVQAFFEDGAVRDGSVAAPAALVASALAEPAGAFGAGLAWPFDAGPWIVAAWAAGAGTLSLRMACGWLWVRRLCRVAQADADGRWQACVDRLSPRLGISRKVALRLVGDGDSPVTAGWWRPVVLLPVAVAMRLPADLVEALLAHELAHVSRHDYLVNLLQGAAEALLFYHPVTWWLSHRIRSERELVADDLAAAALGDRRRLALALSELDRDVAVRSPAPQFHYAPAAHGGHLMSRIQQLVRPQRRAIGGTAALPLVGLALVGVAFYAHARMAPDATAAQSTPAPAAATTPAVAAEPLPTPAASPGTRVLPVVPVAPATRATPADRAQHVAMLETGIDGEPYALVREGEDGYTMSGSTSDMPDIRAAQRAIDGDFLWFRRDGKAWVVRDAETLARARAAWAATDALSGQMQQLEARMKPHSERMEALGARMEAISIRDPFDTPELRASTEALESLGERMAPLAEQQVALGMQMQAADEAGRERLSRQMEALERQREALAEEMERHAQLMEVAAERLEQQHAPMEALAREMEAASRPMEAVGQEMAALGERIGEQSRQADARVRQLIDDAWRSGRAQPAPARQ